MKKIFILLFIGIMLITPFTVFSAAENSSYTVKTGDSLWKISQKFNIPLEKIMEINDLTSPSLIFVGQELIITTRNSTRNENSEYITYTINPGDILWNIAQRYSTTVEKLIHLNNINNAYDLYIGRKLLIPVTTHNRPQLYLNNYYRVQTGENLSEIADYYGLSEQKLRTLNYLNEDDQVYPGQRLKMPVNPALSKRHELYRVVNPQGEYLFDIAYNKGVSIKSILKANYLRDPNQKFSAGKVLLISLTPESKVTWIDYENGKPVNTWISY